MWLPTPIYERIPQFWFLLGLLFISGGVYLGFEFVLSFWYIGVGFACCAYGVGIFLLRLRFRQSQKTQVVEQPAQPVETAEPAETAEAVVAE